MIKRSLKDFTQKELEYRGCKHLYTGSGLHYLEDSKCPENYFVYNLQNIEDPERLPFLKALVNLLKMHIDYLEEKKESLPTDENLELLMIDENLKLMIDGFTELVRELYKNDQNKRRR